MRSRDYDDTMIFECRDSILDRTALHDFVERYQCAGQSEAVFRIAVAAAAVVKNRQTSNNLHLRFHRLCHTLLTLCLKNIG